MRKLFENFPPTRFDGVSEYASSYEVACHRAVLHFPGISCSIFLLPRKLSVARTRARSVFIFERDCVGFNIRAWLTLVDVILGRRCRIGPRLKPLVPSFPERHFGRSRPSEKEHENRPVTRVFRFLCRLPAFDNRGYVADLAEQVQRKRDRDLVSTPHDR